MPATQEVKDKADHVYVYRLSFVYITMSSLTHVQIIQFLLLLLLFWLLKPISLVQPGSGSLDLEIIHRIKGIEHTYTL